MKISENIQYKLRFILEKLKNNETLTSEEQEYYNEAQRVIKNADALELQTEIANFNPNNQEIQNFLNEIEAKIKATIPKTASKKKLKAFAEAITKIKQLRAGYISLLHEYMIDNYPAQRVNFEEVIQNLMKKDNYTSCATNVGGSENEFIASQNKYTQAFELDAPTITLALELIGGNWQVYNAVKELQTDAGYKPIPEEKWETIPKHLKGANARACSRIAYYGRGRIGNPKEEKIYHRTADILEFALHLNDAKKAEKSTTHQTELTDYFKEAILRYINLPESFTGKKVTRIPEEQLTKYVPLAFFNELDNVTYTKYRQLLEICNYDINKVLEIIRHDDMICSTKMSKSGSGFFNNDGTLNQATIQLAAEYVRGDYQNYELLVKYYKTGDESLLLQVPQNLRYADPSQLERIIYYGRGRIGNPNNHDFDKDYYDLQILASLAAYQEYAKTQGINIWETKAKTHTK